MESLGRADLPVPVRDLAERLGAQSLHKRSVVQLTQVGRMKRKLGTNYWMPFRAVQTIATDASAFEWTAKFGPFGLIKVSDMLAEGVGRLAVTALGIIPLAGAEVTAALTRGELMRYLGELPLAPDAILTNRHLRWRTDGPDRLIVGAGNGVLAAEVTFTLDSAGRVATIFAPDRPRSPTAPLLPTPWRGRYSEYRQHKGRWLPFAAEVAWEVDGISETYWMGQMQGWQINA